MSTRVRRTTTEAERELFHDALADVKPLRPVARPPRVKKTARAEPESPKRSTAKLPAAKPVIEEPAEIGGHRARHVRKGSLEPEARLDLHGMTQDAAHRAILRFLERGRANGARVVLIIPGKSGVLNRQFKLWLAQGDFARLVSGVSVAHKRHGGAGAFYVQLKRARAG